MLAFRPTKINKAIAAVLLTAVVFIFLPTDAFAAERRFPGDQWPAENYQVGKTADIFTEKKIEAVTYPLNLMLLGVVGVTGFSGGGVTAVAQRVFAEIVAGYAMNTSAQGQTVNPATTLVWLNYPPSAYSFQSAEMHTYQIVTGAVTNMSTTFFDWIANLIFFVSKAVVMIANNIVVLCFDSQWVRSGADWISQGVKTVSQGFSGGNGWLYVLFVLALCGLAINVALHLFRARVMSALTAVLTAGLCIALMFFYMTNSNYIVAGVSEFTDNMAGLTMSAASVLSPQMNGNGAGNISPLRQGIAEVTNMAWFANVACPWSAGQFGTANPEKLQITQSEWSGGSNDISSGIEDNYSTAPPSGVGRRLSKSDLEQMVQSGTLYADTLYLGADDEVRGQLLKALSEESLDHGQHKETMFTCAPSVSAAWRHILGAFISFFPAVSYLLLVVFVGVPVIFAQLMLMVLLIFLPIALMLGISGDNGRNAMLQYFKYLIGCFAAKIINGFFLGTVLFFAAAFSQAMLG